MYRSSLEGERIEIKISKDEVTDVVDLILEDIAAQEMCKQYVVDGLTGEEFEIWDIITEDLISPKRETVLALGCAGDDFNRIVTQKTKEKIKKIPHEKSFEEARRVLLDILAGLGEWHEKERIKPQKKISQDESVNVALDKDYARRVVLMRIKRIVGLNGEIEAILGETDWDDENTCAQEQMAIFEKQKRMAEAVNALLAVGTSNMQITSFLIKKLDSTLKEMPDSEPIEFGRRIIKESLVSLQREFVWQHENLVSRVLKQEELIKEQQQRIAALEARLEI